MGDLKLADLSYLIDPPAKPGPRILYGTVTQVSPLQVIVDGDTAASDVNAACTPIVGQRVVMVLQDRILTAVAALDVDTGWRTTGHTVSAGWTVSNLKYRRIGKVVSVFFQYDRTGADIAGGTTGNITNQPILTLPVGFRPASSASLSSGGAGWISAGVIEANGTISVAAVVPGVTISSAQPSLSLGGTFFVD